MLHQAGDKANDRETTEPAHRHIVESAHQHELLHNRNNQRHGWVRGLPFLERLNGCRAGVVVEGKIHSQTTDLLDEFDDGYFGVWYHDNTVGLGQLVVLDEVHESIEELLWRRRRKATGSETPGLESVLEEDQIHVSSWKIETSSV